MAFLSPTSTSFSLPLSFPNLHPRVMTPILYHQHNILIMQDMGNHPDLHQSFLNCTTSQEASILGELLGNFLCCFHTFTKDHISELKPYFINNALGYSSKITWLTDKTQLFGAQGTLDPTTFTEMIKIGDLWPGAVLVPSSRQELIILNWEFCDVCNPAVDVSHFVTFLYLLANFPSPRKRSAEGMAAASAFMKGFLQTYANRFVPKDTKAYWKDVQAMIGIEILVEAGKGRWSSIEACACEGDCLFVKEEKNKSV